MSVHNSQSENPAGRNAAAQCLLTYRADGETFPYPFKRFGSTSFVIYLQEKFFSHLSL